MRKFLYAHFSSQANFCELHRLVYPIRYTGEDFPELDFTISTTDPTEPFHYYVTHGLPPLNNVCEFGLWKNRGGKWILSLDDDYRNIPNWNPAKLKDFQLGLHEFTLDAADYIISSTPALTEALGRQHKTLTAPNLMDVAAYDTPTPAAIEQGRLRVVWAGSKTHSKDLELIEAALDYLIPKYRKNVDFIFVGGAPDGILKKYLLKGLYFEKGVESNVYHDFMSYRIRPHVFLAPLIEHPFNLCKSNIRVLEGWCLSAAVVASPVGEYKVIEEGIDGEYATTKEQWIERIERLINNHKYREKLAVAGRKTVEQKYNWNNYNCRFQWRMLLQQLYSKL